MGVTYPKGGRGKKKDPLMSRSNYMGRIAKEKEAELRALKKPKNWPCSHRDLYKGDRVSQWPEMKRLRRVIGQLKGIIKLLESREFRCNTVIDKLLSASTVLKNIGFFILQRHMIECLKEKDFPGTKMELAKEIELAMRYITKLATKGQIVKGIGAMIEDKDGEKVKIIEHEEKILDEDE